MQEVENTENGQAKEAATRESKSGFASLAGKFDSASETGLKKILLNLPFVLFLVLLAVLHIANNHMAETYARSIVRTEKEVKQLRWQYMTTTSSLMLKSKQSEVARLVDAQGIRELRIPPYKIETEN